MPTTAGRLGNGNPVGQPGSHSQAGPLSDRQYPVGHDSDVLHLQGNLMGLVSRHRSKGVVIDVTALDVMDSFAIRALRTMARMIRLRGAVMVIVGIQPEVAFAMVQLGLPLREVETALDLEEGLAFLDATLGGVDRQL